MFDDEPCPRTLSDLLRLGDGSASSPPSPFSRSVVLKQSYEFRRLIASSETTDFTSLRASVRESLLGESRADCSLDDCVDSACFGLTQPHSLASDAVVHFAHKMKVVRGGGEAEDTPAVVGVLQRLADCVKLVRKEVVVAEPADVEYSRVWLVAQAGDMADAVISALQAGVDAEDTLLNLLGYDRIEFICTLVSNRDRILSDLSAEARLGVMNEMSLPTRSMVRTSSEVELEKALKKMARRERKALSSGVEGTFDADLIRLERLRALTSVSSPATPSGRPIHKFALPANASRRRTDTFERVHIPAPPKHAPSSTAAAAPLITIASQDDPLLSLVFSKTARLNAIQSAVFHAAYHESNLNLLVCAPTGAGKTNVALLAMLNVVRAFTPAAKDKFKMVYVAPMKALAAEMARNFSSLLACVGLSVRELTGDMQLSRREIQATQVIVTTPEKWDVITRKGGDDTDLVGLVRLIVIDEIHLLQDDRGPVIECIVARTLRHVERYQRPIRLVGLSATLPNYQDVARFLRVTKGLFYFDETHRPVPLSQTFIGVTTATDFFARNRLFDDVTYQEVAAEVRQDRQVIVFVHSRNATLKTATAILDRAEPGMLSDLIRGERVQTGLIQHSALAALIQRGVGIHHAGMARRDRNLVEKLFRDRKMRVLVSTATLAWGVNLPAHAVVIKGTEIYDSKRGAFVDIGILDVLQIFGRAGRPQFDTAGHGVIVTTQDKLYHYITLAMRQNPIESQLLERLPDWMNAEVVLGSVTSVQEAIEWLSDTYFYVRRKHSADLREIVIETLTALDRAKMVRFDETNEFVYANGSQTRGDGSQWAFLSISARFLLPLFVNR